MPALHLTNKQSEFLCDFVARFYNGAMDRKLPAAYVMPIFMCKCKLDDGESLEQMDLDCIEFLLDVYFSQFGEQDIDPIAEQTYAKIAGCFPNAIPWYDKMLDYDHVVGFNRTKQQPYLGF